VLCELVNGFVACGSVYGQIFQCVVVIADCDSVTVEEGHGDKKRGALVAVIEDVTTRNSSPVGGRQFIDVGDWWCDASGQAVGSRSRDIAA